VTAGTDEGEARSLPSVGPLDFAEWYGAEYPRVVAVLGRLGASVEARQDLAAEAFARALERWDRVGVLGSPTGWVFQVAMNLLRRQARRARLETAVLLRTKAIAVSQPAEDVWDAVRALPERQSRAIVLHYLLDLPYSEVGRLMGVAQGTVAATLSDARRRLASTLGDDALVEDGDA